VRNCSGHSNCASILRVIGCVWAFSILGWKWALQSN
jgi:hypothetical protein